MKSIDQLIISKKTTNPRSAVYSDFPGELLTEIQSFLCRSGISKLYQHQADMFYRAMKGENVVITTSTASGKTLSFLLPVLQRILINPQTRAIFIYPTKALASDQYRALLPYVEFFGENRLSIGVYDGDTPPNERSRIRRNANIILTNPDMINSAFLPNHSKYGFDFVFSNLKYVIVDELHTYRGTFGSHIANIMRRLSRICKYYNSNVQYLCSSATIANPIELAEEIFGKKFARISNDGSPAPEKHYYFVQPPFVNHSSYRKRAAEIATELIPELVVNGQSFISFCRSRKEVELVLRESRDKLLFEGVFGSDYADRIAGYRSGYKPEERRSIEAKMASGELNGLVSTNALELGIDIGKVDSTILVGYPGTRASFWQQSGRAGRSGQTANTYMILEQSPFDQYIAIDPDWLFSNESENAVVDKNNLYIQLAHVRAAAAELPLSLDDSALFPNLGEIIPVLIKAKELKSENGKFSWVGKEFPAGDYSLRNMDKARYKLIDKENGTVITEMDETQAFAELYPRAIYMHEGQLYQVVSMNESDKTVYANAIDVNYYTDPYVQTDLRVINAQKEKNVGRTKAFFGDIHVSSEVAGYKRVQFHNRQNLGYEQLEKPLGTNFDTESTWLELPHNVVVSFSTLSGEVDPSNLRTAGRRAYKSYFDGLIFALANSAMMLTMTTKSDISADLDLNNGCHSVFIYDMYIGGLGYSEKAFDFIERIIKNAINMVKRCQCKDGCPACVGDYKLDKRVVLWGLENLLNESNPPKDVKIPPEEMETFEEKPFNFSDLSTKWTEVIDLLQEKESAFVPFLSTVKKTEISGNTLILFATSSFYVSWAMENDNKAQIKNILARYVFVPSDFQVEVKTVSGGNSSFETISKRYADLTGR